MSKPIREEMLELMALLVSLIGEIEATVEQLTATGHLLGEGPAAAVRNLIRKDRIKLLELRGNLAALKSQYVLRYGPRS